MLINLFRSNSYVTKGVWKDHVKQGDFTLEKINSLDSGSEKQNLNRKMSQPNPSPPK